VPASLKGKRNKPAEPLPPPWNNNGLPRKVLTILLWFFASAIVALAVDDPQPPRLLLTAQRLRRLKRDRERKTSRWLNFENRVNTVPDSPERGFELALYYAITGDEAKGREAIQWVLAHNSSRQTALVWDWCASLLPTANKTRSPSCVTDGLFTFPAVRDCVFQQIAFGKDVNSQPKDIMTSVPIDRLFNGADLYAMCELIYAVRTVTHRDLRDADPHFYSTLPELLLLSAKPSELNSPPWMLHVAALALVALDPNLPASQFLQSWALEDNQTLRDGPGVAYELLWADPYLPGVGYQNMDTWVYDENGRLFARSGWETNSCWIEISPRGIQQENCPPNWQSETIAFGHLTLIPMNQRCVEIPHVGNNESILVWRLKPGQKLIHGKGKEQQVSVADSAGIWRPGAAVEGKACLSPH
jgi:hypothetical protein